MSFIATTIRRTSGYIALIILTFLLHVYAKPLAGIVGVPTGSRELFLQIMQIPVWIAGALLINNLLEVGLLEGVLPRITQQRIPRLVIQLIKGLVFLLVISGIISNVFHQSVTALWATSGMLGIVLAFALRGVIADTISGMAIQMEAPFKVGDWVNCHTRFGEYIGRVEETNWRTTRLWTTGRNTIVIPNSFITTTIVTNYSRPSNLSRFELLFTLDFSIPTERAMRVLSAAVTGTIGAEGPVDNPRPKVRVDNISENGCVYQIRYYIDTSLVSPSKARNTIIQSVLHHTRHAGMSLSYPRQDVFVADMPWRQKHWSFLDDQVRLLSQLSIFSMLNDDQLEFIASNLKIRSLARKTIVVQENDVGDSMFILAEGMLEVFNMNADGEKVKLAELAPGTFFGEKSLLTGEPRSASVVCASDALVCEITKETMAELFEHHPGIDRLLSQVVTQREISNQEVMAQSNVKALDTLLDEESNQFLSRIRSYFRL